ncbi:MAG: hypothetical protein ABFD89_18490 [Bryobacteraceae bacterium]
MENVNEFYRFAGLPADRTQLMVTTGLIVAMVAVNVVLLLREWWSRRS